MYNERLCTVKNEPSLSFLVLPLLINAVNTVAPLKDRKLLFMVVLKALYFFLRGPIYCFPYGNDFHCSHIQGRKLKSDWACGGVCNVDFDTANLSRTYALDFISLTEI